MEPRLSSVKLCNALIMKTATAALDSTAVKNAYRRWAPIYDETFGVVAAQGRRLAVSLINRREGRVLEVGVGTGLSLPRYRAGLSVTGIDLSEDMLIRAAERLRRQEGRAADLAVMDASRLGFADGVFDTVAAMYVMTVVPDPAAVMREIERVTAPGGEIFIVNHFSRDGGLRGFLEKQLAPYADKIGWHPIFPVERVFVCPSLRLVERHDIAPLGLFSLLRFRKEGP
jgi:phosphatidylethanolamine/phosphatidyl-N-methylethanolamine N-methyltransferase